jgi:hypothetical protein
VLFPDFDVFAAIIDRLPTGIIHDHFVRATDEAKVARFRHFSLVAFQLMMKPGVASISCQIFLIVSFVVAAAAFGGNTVASSE